MRVAHRGIIAGILREAVVVSLNSRDGFVLF
jgi:hypothetical protein